MWACPWLSSSQSNAGSLALASIASIFTTRVRRIRIHPGTIPLEIIEVQSGSYLGEDDIVRFEDTEGRTNA